MRFGSLFSGIGGFDLGLERAGHECAWQVEIDAACARVLADKFPRVARFEDVTQVGAGNLSPVDLICGGFPCQDLSVAGRRAGLAGDRSGLWFEFHRIIAEVTPRWVLIENVPGLLSSNDGRDMGVVLKGLEELGYGWAYRVLDAQFFGVAQRRERVFVVGSARGWASAAAVLFERASLRGDPAPIREAREDVASTIGGGASNRGWTDDLDRSGAFVANAEGSEGICLTSSAGAKGVNNQTPLLAFDLQQITNPNNRTRVEPGGPAPTISRKSSLHIAEAEEVANTLGTHHSHTATNATLAFHLTQDPIHGPVSPAVNSDASTGVLSPRGLVRRLTPREYERLFGFPDDYTLIGPKVKDGPRYAALGNTMAVPVMRWIGQRLQRVDDLLR